MYYPCITLVLTLYYPCIQSRKSTINRSDYFVNGTSASYPTEPVVNINELYTYSSTTVSSKTSSPITISLGCTVQNSTDGYGIAGADGELFSDRIWNSTIQKFNFSTETWSIINENISMNNGGDAASV